MSTQANVAVNAARKAVYDKVESQIHTFEAQLATLKAKAESAQAASRSPQSRKPSRRNGIAGPVAVPQARWRSACP